MNKNRINWLAWISAFSTLCLYGAAIFLTEGSAPASLWANIGQVPFIAFAIVGALILTYRPGNTIGWITLIVGFLFVLGTFAERYAMYALIWHPGSLPAGEFLAWMGSGWMASLGWGLMVTFLLLLFPTGRLPSHRWRSVAWLTGSLITIFILLLSLNTETDDPFYPPFRHPLGIQIPSENIESIGNIVYALTMIFVLLSAISVLVRFRRARSEERQQIKWFAFSVMLLVVIYPITFGIKALGIQASEAISDLLWALGVGGIPVSIGVAILRYRLWDIDVIIRRTIVYAILSALLALLYFGGVTLVGSVVSAVGERRSSISIVISTLAIAAIFTPLRQRVQEYVDRRFYRQKYNTEKILARFANTARDEVGIERLERELLGAVEKTMHPKQAGLWLK